MKGVLYHVGLELYRELPARENGEIVKHAYWNWGGLGAAPTDRMQGPLEDFVNLYLDEFINELLAADKLYRIVSAYLDGAAKSIQRISWRSEASGQLKTTAAP